MRREQIDIVNTHLTDADFYGRLAGRIGAKRAVLVALGVYVLIAVGGFFMSSAIHFYVLAGLVGTVQGGAQALSRSLFGSMVPAGRNAEFAGRVELDDPRAKAFADRLLSML